MTWVFALLLFLRDTVRVSRALCPHASERNQQFERLFLRDKISPRRLCHTSRTAHGVTVFLLYPNPSVLQPGCNQGSIRLVAACYVTCMGAHRCAGTPNRRPPAVHRINKDSQHHTSRFQCSLYVFTSSYTGHEQRNMMQLLLLVLDRGLLHRIQGCQVVRKLDMSE